MQRQPFIATKRFTVAPPKPAVLDDARAHDLLARVLSAVHEINNSNTSLLSFEELYRYSYNLVLYKQGDLLYNGVSDAIKSHLEKERDKVRSCTDATLLSVVRQVYARHCINMRMVKDILMYMDRTFVPQHRKLLIYDQGTLLFREVLVRHADVRPRLQGLLLQAIRESRAATAPTARSASSGRAGGAASGGSDDGATGSVPSTPSLLFAADTTAVASATAPLSASSSTGGALAATSPTIPQAGGTSSADTLSSVDPSLIRGIVGMLVDLGINTTAVYQEDYERHMLAEASQQYHDESREMLSRVTCPEYVVYAERRLEEERARCVEVMHPSTLPRLLREVEDRLIADHAVSLASMEGSGLQSMLQHDRHGDIRRMYYLFSRIKTTVSWRPPAELIQSERDRERLATPVAILRDIVKARIIAEGTRVLFDPSAQKEPFTLIQYLLDLRDKYALIVEKGFNGDRLFSSCLKEGMDNVVNAQEEGRPSSQGPNVVASYLAAYVDECMGREFKALSEPIIAGICDKIIALFRSLSAKDVFEEHYKDRTAKRLLSGKVCSEDIERLMVGKLKQECGSAYTNKLEGMFSDVARSQGIMEAWRSDGRAAALAALAATVHSGGSGGGAAAGGGAASSFSSSSSAASSSAGAPSGTAASRSSSASSSSGVGASSSPTSPSSSCSSTPASLILSPSALSAALAGPLPELDATILTSSHWESRSIAVLPVPKGMPHGVIAIAEAFRAYYLGKHSGRKLVWNCGKGTAEVKARFSPSAVYDLTVSTYQMVVLHAFNEASSVSFKDLSSLDIPDDELRRHLLSLCNPKMKILNKSTSRKDIDDADVFTVNDAFTSKLVRIKVPLISMKSAQAAAASAGGAAGGGAAGGAMLRSASTSGAAGDADAEIAASVEEARKFLIESVIVRIMKTRRHMEHNALVAEVIRMVSTRFVPQPLDIKKRIENLIERDYLERSSDNAAMYSYLA